MGNRVEGCENELDGKKYQILSRALRFQHEDVAFLAQGIKETTERRNSRLVRGRRLPAHRVANETHRRV